MNTTGKDDILLMIVVHDAMFHFYVVLVVPPAVEFTIAYSVVCFIYALKEVSILFIKAVAFFLEGGTQEFSDLALALQGLPVEFLGLRIPFMKLYADCR
jgi:hypothetical protein